MGAKFHKDQEVAVKHRVNDSDHYMYYRAKILKGPFDPCDGCKGYGHSLITNDTRHTVKEMPCEKCSGSGGKTNWMSTFDLYSLKDYYRVQFDLDDHITVVPPSWIQQVGTQKQKCLRCHGTTCFINEKMIPLSQAARELNDPKPAKECDICTKSEFDDAGEGMVYEYGRLEANEQQANHDSITDERHLASLEKAAPTSAQHLEPFKRGDRIEARLMIREGSHGERNPAKFNGESKTFPGWYSVTYDHSPDEKIRTKKEYVRRPAARRLGATGSPVAATSSLSPGLLFVLLLVVTVIGRYLLRPWLRSQKRRPIHRSLELVTRDDLNEEYQQITRIL